MLPTRLGFHRFAANAGRLQPHALAYNLGNFLRTLELAEVAVPRDLFSEILRLIDGPRPRPAPA